MSQTYSPLLNVMIKAADKAARSLLHDFGEVEKLQVNVKGPGDFVSKADLRAEEILYESLHQARPDFAFLMEESGEKNTGKSEYTWVIDPLDGTTNFLYGIPHWCLSIGLMKSGKPYAGVILDPTRNELFRAEHGSGAFMNNSRLRASGRNDLNKAMIAHGGLIYREDTEHYIKELKRVYTDLRSVRRFGAGALDLAYVAAGRFDVFWERGLKPWDMTAGACLITEAGGVVTDFSLKDQYIEKREILATNTHLQRPFKKFLDMCDTIVHASASNA